MNIDLLDENNQKLEEETYDSGNYTLTDEELEYLEPIIANFKRTKFLSKNNYLIAYKNIENLSNLFLTFATSLDSLNILINELYNKDTLFTVIEI